MLEPVLWHCLLPFQHSAIIWACVFSPMVADPLREDMSAIGGRSDTRFGVNLIWGTPGIHEQLGVRIGGMVQLVTRPWMAASG